MQTAVGDAAESQDSRGGTEIYISASIFPKRGANNGAHSIEQYFHTRAEAFHRPDQAGPL